MSAVLIPLAYIIAYCLVFWLSSDETQSRDVHVFVSCESHAKDHAYSKEKEIQHEYHHHDVLTMQQEHR